MTAAEEGVLLLCSALGEKDAHPMTMPQFRELGMRVRSAKMSGDPLRELSLQDLLDLGYAEEQGRRILYLLSREEVLRRYIRDAEAAGCVPLTRLSSGYPSRIIRHLRFSCPPVLFARGDVSLLERPSVALVGSRVLRPENEAFAKEVGRWAAEQGLVLVSGGAAGADITAQQACMEAGGQCVVFVADQLLRHEASEQVLHLSADGFDLPFSNYRALYRNHFIHIQGDRVLVAQCTAGKGGTWQGCMENFKRGWTEIFVFDDESDGAAALFDRGAVGISRPQDLAQTTLSQQSLF